MPKVQLFNTQTEQSDIKKRTYVSKETVNPDATGRKWKNNPHNSKAIIYYVSDEVHEDKKAAKEFLKSRRMGYNDKLK